jgi:hypothetical protein
MRRGLLGVALAIIMAAGTVAAQTAGTSPEAERFADMLRRTDPESYGRFVKLQDARDRSLVELQRAQDRYRAAGPELRALTTPQLRAARRQYAADTRAFLDFLDERDRKMLDEYRRAIQQIDAMLEERRKVRDELDTLTRE